MIVNAWELSRGRSYELDKNQPGSASITMIDLTGECDPTSAGYAFNPGTPAAITLENPLTGTEHTVFRGYIANLNYDLYQTEEYAIATLELVDGLDRLSRMEMYAGTGQVLEWGDVAFVSTAQDGDVWFDEDPTGNAVATRINSVLNSAQWPVGLREIFSGNVGLQETVYAYRTPALTPILDAADAEFPGAANFYIQGTGVHAGKATFHGRLARFNHNDAQYHISHWTAGDQGSAANALISSLTFDKDVNRIINGAMATPKDIADADIDNQRVENSASINAYGSRSESWSDLLTLRDHFDGSTANVATKKFATYYVQNYKDPRVRVNSITLKGLPAGSPKASGTWALMCGVEISDHITLTTTHHGGAGGFAGVGYFVEGLRIRKGAHDYDVEMELDLSPADYYATNPWS